MSYRANSAHVGGALSCVEILVSLYFSTMRIDPKNPHDPKRDRFVFSKAHDAKALYAVLAQRGYFARDILEGYELYKGKLPGHATRFCVPGVEYSVGSLGHGLPMALGVALAAKKRKSKERVFVLISDGECDEGTTWESALFAAHHRLDNLTVIIDYNNLQGYGYIPDVLGLEPLAKKWSSFGWDAANVNGHSFFALEKIYKNTSVKGKKPHVILAHTIKGKGGVEKHINQISSQYKPPTEDEMNDLFGTTI